MSRKIGRWGPARRNLVASFRNLRQARRAMDTLESQGFDAAAIQVEAASAAAPAPAGKDAERAGPVTVAVGSDDPIKVARAEEAISDLDPIEVKRVDEHGDPI
jgi:hypothetical protein